MQKKQMNEKEVYRAAKLRELINKERRCGRGSDTLLESVGTPSHPHSQETRECSFAAETIIDSATSAKGARISCIRKRKS